MNIGLKAKYSFYSALVFFLIANPETYKLMNSVFSSFVGTLASPAGCATPLGLFLHTILFFFVILALMMFPRD
jgi:threonine/homoserine/homoserine lactone efflux protein